MKIIRTFILLIAIAVVLGSCKKNNDTKPFVEGSGDKSKYVFIAYSPGAAGESAPYIISSDKITEGTVDLSNGVETDAYSFVAQNNRLFAAVYGGQGPITPYGLDVNGEVTKLSNSVNATVCSVYGLFNNNEWIGGGFTGSKSEPEATIFRYDAVNNMLAGRATIDMNVAAVGDEWPEWFGVFQVDNDRLYMPYDVYPASGDSKYRDSSWIMVVSYPDLKFKKIIRDGRSGYIGSWFGMHGLKQVEDGDVYAWSTAESSKNPSAFMRIKKGTDEFDQSYFFNIEDASQGLKISRADYISGYKFLISVYTQGPAWTGRTKMAIADVQAKTITWISGIPEHAQMSYKQKVYVEDDKNTVHYVMKDDEGRHFVYNINVGSASATKGLEFVNVKDVTTITKLRY